MNIEYSQQHMLLSISVGNKRRSNGDACLLACDQRLLGLGLWLVETPVDGPGGRSYSSQERGRLRTLSNSASDSSTAFVLFGRCSRDRFTGSSQGCSRDRFTGSSQGCSRDRFTGSSSRARDTLGRVRSLLTAMRGGSVDAG
jgi:hypothetical protein